jgi:hypothetical protein
VNRGAGPGAGSSGLRAAGLHAGILGLLVACALLLAGCATLQQIAALRSVTFAFTHVSDVRVAGVRIENATSFSRLSLADGAKLATAVATQDVPLELVAHVAATNPRENTVRASMVGLDWRFFVAERRMLSGELSRIVGIDPGATADVPLPVRFDLLSLSGGGARDLYDLAVAIAGYGTVQKELRLELVPTIETPMGAMRFPAPIVVRRQPPPR